MDYSILDEQLEKVNPYLKRWFRESRILFLESGYKSIELELPLDFTTNPRDAICRQYMYSIHRAFCELVRTYYYSNSANSIAKELEELGEKQWSNYWKYEMRNYYFRSIIPRYISILDYISVMVNELSKQKLESNIVTVDFRKIKQKLSKVKNKDKIGWLTKSDIVELIEILEYTYVGISSEEKGMLRLYRNKETHRYLIGIDEMTVYTHLRNLTEEDKFYESKGDQAYSFKSKPEVEFTKFNEIIERLIENLDIIINNLVELDIMKKAF